MKICVAIALFMGHLSAAWTLSTAPEAPQYAYVIELDQNPCAPTWLFAVYPSIVRAEEDLDMLEQTYPGYRVRIHTVEVRR